MQTTLRLALVAGATIVAAGIALRLLDRRPSSLRSLYLADVRRFERPSDVASPPVSEADLAALPPQVQTYLRRAKVVGRPRVRSFRAIFRGQMRAAPDGGWMNAEIEQRNYFAPDAPARLFFMKARRWGVPFVGYHRYVGSEATMRVRLAGLLEVVNASGDLMTQSETVTLFNDICFLAPGALLDAPVSWENLDAHRVRATYTNAGRSISAVLSFDEAGDLVGFVSQDRYQSGDGKQFHRFPWSTPLRKYRDFGAARLASEGDARWQEPSGEWTYARLELLGISYQYGGVPALP